MASDSAAKARITKHMNNDHADSLTLYLRHYAKLSPKDAANPKLTDITFEAMTITSSSGTHTVPIDPPMTSWAEVRGRSVDMDVAARKALNIPSAKITYHEWPQTVLHKTVFGLCLLAFASFAGKKYITPGTVVYDKVLPWFPGGPEWFLWLTNKLAVPTIVLHIAETVLLDVTKLSKHGVVRGSKLWWLWVGDCVIEGFGCFDRVNKQLKLKEKEEKDH